MYLRDRVSDAPLLSRSLQHRSHIVALSSSSLLLFNVRLLYVYKFLYRSELYSRHDVLFARRAVTFVENSLCLPHDNHNRSELYVHECKTICNIGSNAAFPNISFLTSTLMVCISKNAYNSYTIYTEMKQ